MIKTTPVPNAVFEYIPSLSEAELKLYLIILRQTLGWKDAKNDQRKVYDWISASQFHTKTGLSRRAVGTNLYPQVPCRQDDNAFDASFAC